MLRNKGLVGPRPRSRRSYSPRTSSNPSAARDRRWDHRPAPVSRSTRRSRSPPRRDTSGGCGPARASARFRGHARGCRARGDGRDGAIRRRELGPVARRYLWLFVRPGSRRAVSSCSRTRSSGTSCSRSCSRSSPGPGPFPPRLPGAGTRPGLADRRGAVDGAIVVGIVLVAVVAGTVGARRRSCSSVKATIAMAARRRPGHRCGHRRPMRGGHLDPPVIEWYSRCAASPFTTRGAEVLGASGSIEPTYLVFWTSINGERRPARSNAIGGAGGLKAIRTRGRTPPESRSTDSRPDRTDQSRRRNCGGTSFEPRSPPPRRCGSPASPVAWPGRSIRGGPGAATG